MACNVIWLKFCQPKRPHQSKGVQVFKVVPILAAGTKQRDDVSKESKESSAEDHKSEESKKSTEHPNSATTTHLRHLHKTTYKSTTVAPQTNHVRFGKFVEFPKIVTFF
jgi:hypothetical protein